MQGYMSTLELVQLGKGLPCQFVVSIQTTLQICLTQFQGPLSYHNLVWEHINTSYTTQNVNSRNASKFSFATKLPRVGQDLNLTISIPVKEVIQFATACRFYKYY